MSVAAVECDYCGRPCEPVETRWLCPACGFKMNCCEGEPLDVLDDLVLYPEVAGVDPYEEVSLDAMIAAGYDPPAEEVEDPWNED